MFYHLLKKKTRIGSNKYERTKQSSWSEGNNTNYTNLGTKTLVANRYIFGRQNRQDTLCSSIRDISNPSGTKQC